MAGDEQIRIKNLENNEFVSVILKDIESIIKNGYDERIFIKEVKETSVNTKDIEIMEIIIVLLEGIGINFIYDLLKTSVKKFSKVKGNDVKRKIEIEYINGDEKIVVKLEEFIVKEDE